MTSRLLLVVAGLAINATPDVVHPRPSSGASLMAAARRSSVMGGNQVSGTVCGAEFNTQRVSLVQAPVTGVFILKAQLGTGILDIYFPAPIGIGSWLFEKSGTAYVRYEEAIDGRTAEWGGTNFRTDGGLSISSNSATRVTGSMSVYLDPVPAPRKLPRCLVQISFDAGNG